MVKFVAVEGRLFPTCNKKGFSTYNEQEKFLGVISMTKEKNINATAEQDRFADEVMTDDELEQLAGGVGGKMYDPFGRHDEDPYGTTGK